MTKFISLFSFLLLTLSLAAQEIATLTEMPAKEPKVAITLGVLQGGGGLVGADLEVMVSNRVSFQLGAGLLSYGAGINYHLKPQINSSMISLAYWHQGIGEYHTQTLLGPSYVFRAKKIFTAQLGLGYALEKGPAWPVTKTQPPAMLLYSIGIYLPI